MQSKFIDGMIMLVAGTMFVLIAVYIFQVTSNLNAQKKQKIEIKAVPKEERVLTKEELRY